jgi:hypothetical protein
MNKPFWVLGNIDAQARRRLFNAWDVEWQATRFTWLSIITFGTLGLVMAALLGKLSLKPISWLTAAGYGALIYSTNVVHSLGHILSGHLVGRPMQANLLTATFDVNIYSGDQSSLTRRVHIRRALGGPLLNLFVGLVSLAVWRWTGWSWLGILGCMHLASGLWTLMPIAHLDGMVIWKADQSLRS